MRYLRLVRLAVVLLVLVGSSSLYPTSLQAQSMCDGFAVDRLYWGVPDANGNVPIDPVGGWSIDCNWNVSSWGQVTSSSSETDTYCGDCTQG